MLSRARPRARALTRALRTTAPTEIAPLLAGVGVAIAAYGVKLLLDASKDPDVQEAVRSGAEAVRKTAASAGEAVRQRSAEQAAAPASARRAESYFTTGVMGMSLGVGAREWSGACAAVVENGEARVVENEQGSRSTPAVVAFSDDGEVHVGHPAKKLLFSRTATAIVGHQQLLGVRYGSDEHEQLAAALPYDVCESDDGAGAVAALVHGSAHSPESLSGRVLAQLRSSGEAALGGRSVLSAVIGTPAAATDAAVAAIERAGKLAGLREVTLIPEAVACARAADVELAAEMAPVSKLGVFALGGSRFSFSLLGRRPPADGEAAWAVLAARALPRAGSESLDAALVDHLADGFASEHEIDLRADHLALHRLHDAAEAAMLELCVAPSASVSLPFISADASGPKHLETSISRARFDELARPTLQSTLSPVADALADAGLAAADLDAVLLAGGSARLPAVAQLAADTFGGTILRLARPEEAVALGAAVHAQELQALEYGAAADAGAR